MRYEIQVGSSSTADVHGTRKRFSKLKAYAIAFITLCAIVGVAIAALVIGTMLAGVIVLAVGIGICVLVVARMLRRR